MRDEITGVSVSTYEIPYVTYSDDANGNDATATGSDVVLASEVTALSFPVASQPSELDSVIEIYRRQVQAYCKQKKWDKAVRVCYEILEASPRNAEAYKLLGNVMQQQGEATDAMGFYAKALALQPNFPEVYSNLGSLYAYQKEWEEAVSYFKKAIEQDSGFAPAYLNLAKVWNVLNRKDDEAYCKAVGLRLQPESGSARDHYEVGQAFEEKGSEEDAIAFYQQAVKQDSQFLEAYQRLTDLLENQGDWKGSVECYRKVIEISGLSNSSSNEANNSGKVLPENAVQPAKPTKASSSLTLATPSITRPATKPPNNIAQGSNTSQNNQGLIQKLIQSSSQVKMLKQPVANDPRVKPAPAAQRQRVAKPVAARSAMAVPTPGQRLFSASRQTGRSVNKAAPVSPIALGQRYIAVQDWPRAIQAFQQAIQQEPKSAGLYRTLAQLFDKNQQQQQAAIAWYRAFVLEPSWPTLAQWLELSEVLQQQGDMKSAVGCYQQVIRLRPDYELAYYRLAELLRSFGNAAAAETVLQQRPGFRKLPQRPDSGKRLKVAVSPDVDAEGNAYRVGQFNGQPSTVKTEADETINRNKEKAFAAHKQGEELRQKERWEEAIAAYSQAAKLNPDFSWSRHSLGDCYKGLSDWKGAAKAYQEAIAINPEFVWSYHSLGQVQEKLLNWGEAIEAYTKAAELDPDSTQISVSLAEALKHGASSSKQKSAEQYLQLAQGEGLDEGVYRQAIALDPSDMGVYERLGRVLLSQKRVDEAIFVCQTGLQVEPNAIGLLLQLAELLAEQAHWERAVECVKRALKIDEHSAVAHFKLGDVLSKKGDLEGAHGAFWRSLQLDANNYWTHQCIGNVCLWQGRFDEAIASYQQVISMNPELATAHKQMGDAYTALGKVDEASEAYARAIELDPQVS